jgi:hypothetical protein
MNFFTMKISKQEEEKMKKYENSLEAENPIISYYFEIDLIKKEEEKGEFFLYMF